MSKDVIHAGGQDQVVREDTAKGFRGVNWALLSVGAFVIIAAVLLAIFFLGSASDGDLNTPQDPRSANSK